VLHAREQVKGLLFSSGREAVESDCDSRRPAWMFRFDGRGFAEIDAAFNFALRRLLFVN
jgi:hypothetical protein